MISATGVRIGWADLPPHVRAAIERLLGGTVEEATSQPGGFSPGTADRVVTAGGRRAFVKAVSPAQNAESPSLHRREALIAAALPAEVPAPRLLGSYDDGTWVALVLEDIDGRHPATPWHPDELTLVLRTLTDLATALTPPPASLGGSTHLPTVPTRTTILPAVPTAVPPSGLPTAVDALGDDISGWHRVAADLPPDLDPWTAAHLDDLRALGDRGVAALAGNTVVHSDLRADNLLLTRDGGVRLVDWPWACVGPAWLDSALLLVNVNLFGGHDTTALLHACAATFDADVADLVAVLAGVAGYFTHASGKPPPPGLPTVRDFQRAQGEALLSWLRDFL